MAIAVILSVLVGSTWQKSWTAVSPTSLQVAQETPEAAPVPDSGPALVISGTYEDPQGKFQVGILDGYTVSSAAGSALFQLGDGSLAYSVIWVPLNSDSPLPDIGMVDIAQETLGRGEGFQTQTFSTVPGGGLQIAWTGRLSQGTVPPQSVSGRILVKQQGAEAYVLVVAALEDDSAQVPAIVSTLMETLVIL